MRSCRELAGSQQISCTLVTISMHFKYVLGLSMGWFESGLRPTQNQLNNFGWQGDWLAADCQKPRASLVSFWVKGNGFGRNRWSKSDNEILSRTGWISTDLIKNRPDLDRLGRIFTDLVKIWLNLDRSHQDLHLREKGRARNSDLRRRVLLGWLESVFHAKTRQQTS